MSTTFSPQGPLVAILGLPLELPSKAGAIETYVVMRDFHTFIPNE